MKMKSMNRVDLDYNDEEECLSLKLDQDKSSRDFFNNVEKQSVARGSRSRSISPINISFSLGDDESVSFLDFFPILKQSDLNKQNILKPDKF
jgi:hypothetical protein